MVIDRTMLSQTQGGGKSNMAHAKLSAKERKDRLTQDIYGTEIPENEGPEDMTEGNRKPFDPKTGDERAGTNELTNPDWEHVKRARLGDDVVDRQKEQRKAASK